MSFKEIDSKMDLPKVETDVLAFWDANKTFEKSLEQTKDKPRYSFYDGPPFATGTPHYGHIVASTMKDVVPRYWTMKGYHVPRVWGWDCHGLPIENIAEKELGIKQKKDIEALGVKKFNDACRSKVLEYTAEWKSVIHRLGRWADMDHAYKTMDLSYMESVWWVFKQLWDRDLIYESYRSMHICPRCETTLSQSEVAEGYRDVKDLSVVVEMKLVDEPDTSVLAWTTTPWTLIGNVALAIGLDIDYVKVKCHSERSEESQRSFANTQDDKCYIVAKDRVKEVFKDQPYEIAEELKGTDLVGKSYKPLFDYYSQNPNLPNHPNGWKIYPADFVVTEEGTGIVHVAPAFGEEDMNLGKEKNLPFIQHIGMDGIIKPEATDFAGMHVKPIDDVQKTDVEIIKYLAAKDLLFSKEKYEHSYPHCWRCDTPLLNYATTSWFVNITKIKSEALELAKKINWSPKHIKQGRFGNWLEGARDWSISRQRYWASAIPIWKCDKCGELKVVGSVEELRKNSKQKITKILFVRHGESEKNVLGVKSNTLDRYPLTELGRIQALSAADKLSDNIDIIISSPVLRTKETAEILSQKIGIKVIFDDLISEYSYGNWNDKTDAELLSTDDDYQSYKKLTSPEDRFHFRFGKTGETRHEITQRVGKFLDKITKEYAGKTIAVVSHGGINAAIKKTLNNCSFEEYFRKEQIDHETIEEFYLKDDGTTFDLHKDEVDDIVFDCTKCDGKMTRIPDVIDCWFESGSMPYAQAHYPFENKEESEKTFPAEFIAEGVDQTRAWFYYLHTIATAIRSDVAFKNVIVNGIVLAEDGKKMSKRLQNYPDPMVMFDKYGADVLRLYLLTSPVMQAENINFAEKDLAEIQRGLFRMLWNSYSFFVLYANIDKWDKSQKTKDESQKQNVLDRWILSELNSLILEVNESMTKYELTKAARLFGPFVDNLSNWYIRRCRKRFWKTENNEDKNAAYHTLYEVLVTLAKLMAPFTPFLAEDIYRNLTGEESVHLVKYPEVNKELIDKNLVTDMAEARKIIELGLAARAEAKIKVRQPLLSIRYHGKQLDQYLEAMIADELNLRSIMFTEGDANKIELDTEISEELKLEGFAREIIRNIQTLRKDSNFKVEDRITLYYKTDSELLNESIEKYHDLIVHEVLATSCHSDPPAGGEESQKPEGEGEFKIDDENIWIGITRK
ncbi:MAG: class I tRNA ligase family protein [bacterium]|nr:class I tRNA ligase family protein [bacterium]